jgi:hypothetical protein
MLWGRAEQILRQSDGATPFMRQNWPSNRIFKSFDDIVDHCCYAWNTLIDRRGKCPLARRDWQQSVTQTEDCIRVTSRSRKGRYRGGSGPFRSEPGEKTPEENCRPVATHEDRIFPRAGRHRCKSIAGGRTARDVSASQFCRVVVCKPEAAWEKHPRGHIVNAGLNSISDHKAVPHEILLDRRDVNLCALGLCCGA